MKKIATDKRFMFFLEISMLYCVASILFCIFYGSAMAATHLEPHYLWRDVQVALSIVMGGTFLLIKKVREKIYWFIIPMLLGLVAFLYVTIVSQYPCCTGG